ncbi:MAG TPA: GAF domain-containing protein [Bryobacteraceae bacterium]|nr:GAF domain-containing protein [Bryobacteraceae bacterium]
MIDSLLEEDENEASHLSILHQISTVVSSEISIDEVLGEIIGLTVRATQCDACLVYLLDPTSNELVLRGSQMPHAADLGKLRMKMGEGVAGWVAEHKSPVSLPSNAPRDARFKHIECLIEDTYQALLSVPLISGGSTIGIINVHHREAHGYTDREIALVTFIGEQIGNALAKSLLEEENGRLAAEAREMRSQLEARKVIERAKGILQRRDGITEEEAYLRLRNQSRRLQRPMKELADAIILADEIGAG